MSLNQKTNYLKSLIRRPKAVLYYTILFGGCLLNTACSNTKYLPEGEKLYTDGEVKIKADGKVKKEELQRELKELLRPQPNEKFLGLRPKLWFYNIAGKPTGKGLRYFIKNKLGEPPVLFSQVDPEKNEKILTNHLYNTGYFQAEVTSEAKEQGDKKVKMIYTASVNEPYTIKKLFYPVGDSLINKQLRNLQEGTLLKEGEQYSLEKLKDERERIDNVLKDQGLYFFNPDFLIFKVDSTIGERKVNVYLQVKDRLPPKATKVYTIDRVYIYPNYSLGRDSTKLNEADTAKIRGGYYYIKQGRNVRPRVIIRSIFLKPGEIYTHEAYDISLNRLMNLGVYRFVNIRFKEADSTGETGKLNAYVYLTPLEKKSIRVELDASSKSNNFVGPDLTLSFRNRNFLGGAELFVFNTNMGYETLISKKESGLNSYEIGANAELTVPRFFTPFNIRNKRSRIVPRTKFDAGFQVLSRVRYFDLNTFNFSYGYMWNETVTKRHELNPVSVSFMQLARTTDRFRDLLRENPYLTRSYQRQFILGSNYSFTYNSKIGKQQHHNDFYFNGTADISGNLAFLGYALFTDVKPTVDTPYTIFSIPFSQYSRAAADFRHYLNFTQEQRLVSRVMAGIGVPYGNSSILPYTKQFFIGGNNSVRAFQPRSLGPGAYEIPDSLENTFFLDQAGDIKLEGNLEYRYRIIGIFKGAFFVDAGNVWLIRPNPFKPRGEFLADSFYRQIAVGTGLGLRIDATFFVLRFDLAFPLRKPWLPDGERWVVDEIRPGIPEWRRDNLVLNIAIGYPF